MKPFSHLEHFQILFATIAITKKYINVSLHLK